MDLKTWLNGERGRRAALAEFLKVSPGRITQMADDRVPPKFMLAVRDFTKRAVTLEAMLRPGAQLVRRRKDAEVTHG